MVFPAFPSEQIRWGLTLLLPLLAAFLLPGTAPSRRTRRWWTALQVTGLALVLIGLIAPLLLFPVVLGLMFCAIFRGLLQVLSQFSAGLFCPELPLAVHADALIQPGVALLVFATARRWRLAR